MRRRFSWFLLAMPRDATGSRKKSQPGSLRASHASRRDASLNIRRKSPSIDANIALIACFPSGGTADRRS